MVRRSHDPLVDEQSLQHQLQRKGRRPLRANDDETKTCREFTLEGIGQTSSGYAPHQRQQDPCSSRRG
jgi:hypothetical protein